MTRRVLRVLGLTIGVGLAIGACSGATTEAPSGAPTDGGAATRIEVRLTDAFKIEPGDFTVPAGESVTFVVMNAGVLDHEFFIGDEEAQAAHDEEMLSSGGVVHDGATAVGVKPGQTKELTLTLEAGATIAGCHVPGHYAGGMKTTITATE